MLLNGFKRDFKGVHLSSARWARRASSQRSPTLQEGTLRQALGNLTAHIHAQQHVRRPSTYMRLGSLRLASSRLLAAALVLAMATSVAAAASRRGLALARLASPAFLELGGQPLLLRRPRAATSGSGGARGLHATAAAPAPHDPRFDNVPDRRGSSSLKWTKYGPDVLPLWVADMDFRAPECVIEALKARAEHGVYGYSVPLEEVTQEVVRYLERTAHYKIEPDWIVWSHGLVPALTVASRMAGGAGDEVMTNTPIYPPFLWTPKTAGMATLQVPLVFDQASGQWTMDFAKMEQLVTPRTKMFTLCNPHNPVGKVFTKDELARLGDFCKRHDLILLSDEIYHDLILDPAKTPHVPIAALGDAELMKRTIILHAASKTYNVPGLSCAYAVIPDLELRTRFKKAARGFVTEINAFGYEACYASYKGGEDWRQGMLKYLLGNRDFLVDFIKERMPLFRTYPNHDATYLLWVDTSGFAPYLPKGGDPASFFLEKAKVAVSDGRDFGAHHHVRINFGCPRSRLLEGLEKMEAAYKAAVAAGKQQQ